MGVGGGGVVPYIGSVKASTAGVNIKRENVLSPNDQEVASSSQKHTQFKTRVHKPYPISDQNGRN